MPFSHQHLNNCAIVTKVTNYNIENENDLLNENTTYFVPFYFSSLEHLYD